MVSFIATSTSITLVFGFALLQFSLTLGSPLGAYALGGRHRILPLKMRFVSGFFSALFVLVGLAYLQRTGLIPPILNASFNSGLLIVYTLFLAYAIIGNGFITKSKKEKHVMTPLSIIGFVAGMMIFLDK